MTKIDRVLSELSKLYEFNRNIRKYRIRKTDPPHKETAQERQRPNNEHQGHHRPGHSFKNP